MRNFISEDMIEQAILNKLRQKEFGYDVLVCNAEPAHKEDLNDKTSRVNKKACVLPNILAKSLYRLNPKVPQDKLDAVIKDLTADFSDSDLAAKNYELYNKLRNSIKITTRKNGKEDFEFIKLIDFDNPKNNTFTAVSQMWIQGRYYWRRPDIIIFVNGLPLVFIELKNSIVKVQEAYNKNLKDYLRDIPNLFAFNQVCVLSNGIETRLGAFNATYDFFFEWLKQTENEKIDRKAIKEQGVSADYFVEGLLHKETLIDYVENFVLFENKVTKIIAKNHQFLGVNNLMESFKNRKELNGKLGVFWHTQGSGKSYSMVMFARKVRRKLEGNFTFLIITDRDDLDTQIYKNFVRTEVIGNKEECQPKNGEQLREYLQGNKPFIFTLIHKFHYDKGKKYPLLTKRDDIIVMVDEAHRTQYKDLAENMRTALPNANFIAFTGTPLLGSKRLTNQWFGDYVSEYNFAQSVEDGSTVPLFYSRRVPEVGLTNDFLDDDVVDIIEHENLNETETRVLENSGSHILEVIKRDDRLDKIAQDIAHHFPRRGFLGKGMVISVDKFTAVKMYDKVQHYWTEEKKKLVAERNAAGDKAGRDKITAIINYMDKVEMAVVVSEEADETEKFAKQGLDITKHREKMNKIINGLDIEDRFKDSNNSLQLVFVCAMWLTGFDVKKLSTLYLDKPMKGHTLMQAIARANRVYPGKPCGIVVDYVNVFKYIQKALGEYATGSNGKDFPVKNIDKLINLIDQTIAESDAFLTGIGINLDKIIDESGTLDKLEEMRQAYNKLVQNDENKDKFKVLANTLVNLYEAAKPEIFERHWSNPKFAPIAYLQGLLYNLIDDKKIEKAKLKLAKVLDNSVTSKKAEENDDGIVIHQGKIIDISKINVDELRKELKVTPYRAVEIDNLKAFLEEALRQMINKNCERTKFSERYKGIIDRYNAGGSENEDYYEQLVKLIADMKKENVRHLDFGLSEEELEIYDLLTKGKKLTKVEEQKVILSSKDLFERLNGNRNSLFVTEWYKDEQPKARVRDAISETLNTDLPASYDKEVFNIKTDLLLNHFIDMAVQGYGWVGCQMQ
jgi:type I restriction enzyme R subunit